MRRRVTVVVLSHSILLLVAVALCLGAPTAGAVPAKKLDNNLGALWTTILQTPTPRTPSSPARPAATTSAARLRRLGPVGDASCTVKPGTKIFVAASAVECSTFEGQPPFAEADEANYGTCAQRHERPAKAPTVTVDGKSVPVTEVDTPLLNITLPAENIFERPVRDAEGLSVARGWVALLHPLTPGTIRSSSPHPVTQSPPPSRPRRRLARPLAWRGGA